jgi:pimeloyl-ACP methyl ester carboxylesterase
VRIEQRVIGGVQTFEVTPEGPIAPENRSRVLINLHGGAYIVNGGQDAVLEAIPVAHLLGIRVIAVDYRMPPADPFPAALDDAVVVYRSVIETADPRTVGVYGTSAGGGLTAALLLKLRAIQLPLPGAVGLLAPWSDLTQTGDSYFTNAEIDPTAFLVPQLGFMPAPTTSRTHSSRPSTVPTRRISRRPWSSAARATCCLAVPSACTANSSPPASIPSCRSLRRSGMTSSSTRICRRRAKDGTCSFASSTAASAGDAWRKQCSADYLGIRCHDGEGHSK